MGYLGIALVMVGCRPLGSSSGELVSKWVAWGSARVIEAGTRWDCDDSIRTVTLMVMRVKV